ncbi:hypothetical protein LT42_25450 [Pseudomonas lutea]|uniref:Uncharacterized protein n=1 Tax=Pseudomonas lutea TaxID=243924 RepID=A0A9X0EAA1_9PSED|nr:hypothetical protein LT42_25450 [Pseudomonas lutea]
MAKNTDPNDNQKAMSTQTKYPVSEREITAQVILNLDEKDRPRQVICTSCPKAMWITSQQRGADQLDCFCLVMKQMTYTTWRPTKIFDCEVLYMLEAEAAEKAAREG